MNPSPDRPDTEGASKQKRWVEDLGAFASDATVHLGRLGRKLRVFNAAAASWVSTTSWRRMALIGFVLIVGTSIVGDITGFNRQSVTIDPVELRKPVDIVIHSDARNVHIQPSVGGKPTRAIDVPIPDVPTPPDAPAAPKRPAGKDNAAPAVTRIPHGIVFEKDGKRVVIDRHGVRVLEGDAARRDAEATAAAEDRERAGDKDAGTSGDAVVEQSAVDSKQAIADATRAIESGKSSRAEADKVRKIIADDMSLQVKAAVEDAKDEVQSAISDEIHAATRRAAPRSGYVLWELLKALLVLTFVYFIVLKSTSNTKRRAAVAVQSAAEVAERESLKRQVSEAKMQMMQAQVEPHFLFNTLASIEHLIETDPPRASMMQRNLIQYLRAALPQMREHATDLGREVDLVRAYLDILKVRMEERLQVSFAVPNGLRSADFPPMMLQSLVENAIKHGLEPKAEGGRLEVGAEIVHGDLEVSVADTGLGFAPGGASTSGTGVGLTNIRERLKLLYGERASVVIEANVVEGAPQGTRVTISVPYQSRRQNGNGTA